MDTFSTLDKSLCKSSHQRLFLIVDLGVGMTLMTIRIISLYVDLSHLSLYSRGWLVVANVECLTVLYY